MTKVCHVCGQEKEHKSWKATTCNECLEAGLKWYTAQPFYNKSRLEKIIKFTKKGGDAE